MNKLLSFLVLLLTASAAHAVTASKDIDITVTSGGTSDEEFVGPFPSWMCVKSLASGTCGAAAAAYGTATGDGSTNDAAAIQAMLDRVGFSGSCAAGSGCAPALYFPAGNYRINGTLTLAAQQYVSLIGQDPTTTALKWGGSFGGTILRVNGVSFSRIDRLTFDGQGIAAVAVDQSWSGSGNYFDSGNEYADDVFKNAEFGFRCGNLGFGCAETSMLRAKFLNNSNAGISMRNANALDMWVWYSVFSGNVTGITNQLGAGNFNVYNSNFSSVASDLAVGNTSPFAARYNFSQGSALFFGAGTQGSPANISIQGNTILDTPGPYPTIQILDMGPLVLLDNVIRSGVGATVPVVEARGFSGQLGDLFSMGNTFTLGSTISCLGGPSSPIIATGHCHTTQDQIVNPNTINPTAPILPGVPPNNGRAIFEASASGSGTTCSAVSPCSAQTAICLAATGSSGFSAGNCTGTVAGGSKKVVHLLAGTYSASSTLSVPANSEIQIIGDGYNSLLSDAGANPVLRLNGPSKVVLRDFKMVGNATTAGLEVTNADQIGSRIFMEQVNLSRSQPNLFVNALDRTLVELHNTQHYSTLPTGSSVNVVGGSSAAGGMWLGGATNLFNGVSFSNYNGYTVSAGAHVNVLDMFNDGACSVTCLEVAKVTGPSTFSFAGAFVSVLGGSTVNVTLNDFHGTAALVNLYTLHNINITGSGSSAKVLGLGLVGPSPTFFSNTSSPAATTEFLNGMQDPTPGGGGSAQLNEVPSSPNATFLTDTLKQMRSTRPSLPAPSPNGITDVRLYRVFVENFTTGVQIKAAP